MHSVINHPLLRGHKAAQGSEGFAEGAHYYVHFLFQPEIFGRASPVSAQYAYAVRIVHHHPSVVALGQADYFGQIGQIALHGKHSVHHYQLTSFSRSVLQLLG